MLLKPGILCETLHHTRQFAGLINQTRAPRLFAINWTYLVDLRISVVTRLHKKTTARILLTWKAGILLWIIENQLIHSCQVYSESGIWRLFGTSGKFFRYNGDIVSLADTRNTQWLLPGNHWNPLYLGALVCFVPKTNSKFQPETKF